MPTQRIVGGVNADQGRYDYFVTVFREQASFGPSSEVLAGVLLTPNVILFEKGNIGHYPEAGSSYDLTTAVVTVGNALGSAETRSIVEVKETVIVSGPNISDVDYFIAVLDTPSTKVPVTIDDGTCGEVVFDGCLEVTGLGRGLTVYSFDEDESRSDPTPNQVLQEIELEFLNKTECLDLVESFDLRDWYIDAFEASYDCPGLDCENVNQTRVDLYLEIVENYDLSDAFEQRFTIPINNNVATCITSADKDFCTGDKGAPLLIKGTDILVGLLFDSYIDDCIFEGQSRALPIPITLTQGIIDSIKADIQSLSGAVGQLDTPNSASECACPTPTPNPTPSPNTSTGQQNVVSFTVLALAASLALLL